MEKKTNTKSENSLASLKESKNKKLIQDLIDTYSQPSGFIDIRQIANALNLEIILSTPTSSMDVAVLTMHDDTRDIVIYMSPEYSVQEQNCALAWIIAKYLIDKNKNLHKDILCTIFNVRDFRRERYTRAMLLATRLLMTEDAISKMTGLDNIKLQKELSAFILPEFANAGIRGHSVSFLIGNDII